MAGTVVPLSGLDASFLYLETPHAHMHLMMVAILDPTEAPGGYSFEGLRDFIASRMHPQFRRRLVATPLDLHHPLWADEPDLDVDYHIRRTSCPAPGGPREFAALCGRINGTSLDRSRPPWEMWIVEGLADGRIAFLTKVHHSVGDGALGLEVMMRLFSLDRDTPSISLPELSPPPIPTGALRFVRALGSRLRQPVELIPLLSHTAAAVTAVAARRRNSQAPRGATPLVAPHTSFNRAITAQRSMAFSRLPLARVKAVSKALDVTVNDVVLAVCAGALRSYLSKRGELPRLPLVAVCPVSTPHAGTDGPSSGNKVSGLFSSLATNVCDPIERVRAVQKSMQGAKEEFSMIGEEIFLRWAQLMPPTLSALGASVYSLMKLADHHRPIYNLVISNVAGPQFPVYLGGMELLAMYPTGPVFEGAGVNVTVLSFNGSVDFGVNAASNVLPDIWDLADSIEPAFEEIAIAASGLTSRDYQRPQEPHARSTSSS